MSFVIKQGATSPRKHIRALSQSDSFKGLNDVLSTPQENLEDTKVETLLAENAKLKEFIKEINSKTELAVLEAKKAGKKEAEQSIQKDYEKAHELLSINLAEASKKLETQLMSIDGLALLVAQTALENILNPTENYRDLMTGMISKQMQNLRNETVLAVRVSGEDFEDDGQLDDLAFALDLRHADIKIDSKIRAGDCVIDLHLGHLELSVKDQWDDLQALFRNMATVESS